MKNQTIELLFQSATVMGMLTIALATPAYAQQHGTFSHLGRRQSPGTK